MSRFYDALKQAGRSAQDEAAQPEALNWAAWGIDRVNAPDADPGRAGKASAPATAASVVEDAWAAAEEESKKQTEQAASETAEVLDHAGSAGPEAAVAVELPSIVLDPKARLITNATNGAVMEQYRRLRTKLIQQHELKPFRSLAVTSPGAQEGKTLTTINLALTFAMLFSFRVLVVDGDLRRGSLTGLLGAMNRPGFSNLIDGSASIDQVILACEEVPFSFIPRGTSDTWAAELLQASHLGKHIQKLTERFALVIMDTPPMNLVADGHLLAGNCDAAIVVARAYATTRKALESAVHDLNGVRVLGTVLNAGTRAKRYRGYSGAYSKR